MRAARTAIDREIDVAAMTGVQLPDNAVAVEQRPRLQEWRQRQLGGSLEDLASLALRQFVDPHDLDREIVLTAAPQRLLHDDLRRLVEIGGMRLPADRGRDETGADMLINAICGEQENIPPFDLKRLIVDFDLRIDP